MRRGCTAAFSTDGENGTEALVIVAETNAKTPEERSEVEQDISSSVTKALGINVQEVRLIPPKTIPKTSSGKIQRRKTCELYLTGQLQEAETFPTLMKSLVMARSGWGFGLYYLRKSLLRAREYYEKLPDLPEWTQLPELPKMKEILKSLAHPIRMILKKDKK